MPVVWVQNLKNLVAYLWRGPQSETVTAPWKPWLRSEPTSWMRRCSAPVYTSGTGSGNISASEQKVSNTNIQDQQENKLLPLLFEDTPVEKRGLLLRSGRPGDRWGRGNAPLCAVGWRKPTSTDTWETASASMDDPGSALQETRVHTCYDPGCWGASGTKITELQKATFH